MDRSFHIGITLWNLLNHTRRLLALLKLLYRVHVLCIIEPNTTPAIQPSAPNKTQLRLNSGLSGAYLGLVWVRGSMARGSIGLHYLRDQKHGPFDRILDYAI